MKWAANIIFRRSQNITAGTYSRIENRAFHKFRTRNSRIYTKELQVAYQAVMHKNRTLITGFFRAANCVYWRSKQQALKPSNELFLLIKSMNRNEKGYFKKFASINSKSGEGNYLRLFDCLDEMDEYDEAVIKKKFKGEKFLTQLNVTRLYLQKMIIKSLRNYHSETDPEIERLNGMVEVQMLVKKQLYDSALRALRTLKTKMEKQEVQLTYLYLMQLEYQIMLRKGMYTEILEFAEVKFEREKFETDRYINLCHYRYLQGITMSKTQMEGYTRNEASRDIEKLLADPLLVNPDAPLTFKAQVHRLEIMTKCYLKLGQPLKAYESARGMVDLFRANPAKIELVPYNYFAALNSLVNRCIASFQYKEALSYLEEEEKIVRDTRLALSDSQRFEIWTQVTEKRLVIYGGLCEFAKGIESEKELWRFIGARPIRKEMRITILYFSAICYTGAKLYNEALNRVNELVHGDYDDMRKDLVFCAHMLNVIIHLELKNFSLLKRIITVAKNYGSKHKFPVKELKEFFAVLTEYIRAVEKPNEKARQKAGLFILNNLDRFDFIDSDMMMWWLKSNGITTYNTN